MIRNVAIMGATGAVGQELLKILEQRNFPLQNLKLLASERSVGREYEFKGEKLKVELTCKDAFKNVDLVLSSAGASVSKEFAPIAVDAGAVVVDNTSFFRMDPNVPLVVPEVNPEDIKLHKADQRLEQDQDHPCRLLPERKRCRCNWHGRTQAAVPGNR